MMENEKLQVLLSKMTVKQKVAQLLQLNPFYFEADRNEEQITGPMTDLHVTEEEIGLVGSILGVPDAENARKIQNQHLTTDPNKIPLLFMIDAIHGYKTIYPIPLAMAGTFNPAIVEETASMSAYETSTQGHHVTFSPMVDLVRDARWGRVMEASGEDVYVNQEMARAFVRGYQGPSNELHGNQEKIAACVKHFAGYGMVEGGREYNTVDLSRKELFQNHLPAYEAALDEGAKLVMSAFNLFEGVPVSANTYIFRDILRERLAFEGVTISDWGAVKELVYHGVTGGKEGAAELALKAGIDIEMMSSCYIEYLEVLVERGEIETAILDEAVLRILTLKNDLGLFENPYRGLDLENKELSEEHLDIARRAAEESFVLLKNDEQTLPLNTEAKVALVGPFAESDDLLGGWVIFGKRDETPVLATKFKETFTNATVVPTEDHQTITDAEIAEAVAAAKLSDSVVLAVGETSDESGEASSRSNIQLAAAQQKLIKAVAEVNENITLLIFNGRPLELTGIEAYAKAILIAWFPGSEGANALTRVLSGKVAPSAKLTMSFPRAVGQVPIYYNQLPTGRPVDAADADAAFASSYLDVANTPLYPFGYGLSYGELTITDWSIANTQLQKDEAVSIEVTVANTGTTTTSDVVQLYMNDPIAAVSRPIKELKRFHKLTMAPQTTATITLTLPYKELGYYDSQTNYRIDAGELHFTVGFDSAHVSERKTLTVKEGS